MKLKELIVDILDNTELDYNDVIGIQSAVLYGTQLEPIIDVIKSTDEFDSVIDTKIMYSPMLLNSENIIVDAKSYLIDYIGELHGYAYIYSLAKFPIPISEPGEEQQFRYIVRGILNSDTELPELDLTKYFMVFYMGSHIAKEGEITITTKAVVLDIRLKDIYYERYANTLISEEALLAFIEENK